MEVKEEIKKYVSDVKGLPVWLQYVVALATIFATVFGAWGVYIVLNSPIPAKEISKKTTSQNATTTINVSDLLSKALALDTIIERQDFLIKYIGSQVYGEGVIKEISRYGDKLLLDVDVNNSTITCPQDGSGENEKKLVLLKGKSMRFLGIWTYKKYFDHDSLYLDDCVLQ